MVNAIVTLLFTSSYLPGALVLGKSLRQTNQDPNVRLVVLLTAALTSFEYELLKSVYDEILEADLIRSNDVNELALLKRPELSPTYSKVNLFKLTQFDKVLYLDSDTLPLSDLTHLFGNSVNEDQILAAPDSGWPDIFNTGLFLIHPSISTYDALLSKINDTKDKSPSFDGADQGLLNEFFIVDSPDRQWLRLPFLYNVTPSGQYQYQPAFQFFYNDIKLLHFIGAAKPWSCADRDGERYRWWDKYHEYFGYASVKETIHGVKPKFYIAPPAPEPTPAPAEGYSNEPPQEYQQEYQQEYHQESAQYEEAAAEVIDYYQEAADVLSNPSTFEIFDTVKPDANQWDPSRDEPPMDGKPEAESFPDLNQYYNEWDKPQEAYQHFHEEYHHEYHEEYHEHHEEYHEHHEEHHEHDEEFHEPHEEHHEHHEEYHEQPQQEWKPNPIFPWEFELEDDYKPERVFSNTDEFSFDNPWENLPIFKKIKETKKTRAVEEQAAQLRASQLAKEEEDQEMIRRGNEVEKISADVDIGLDIVPREASANHSSTDTEAKETADTEEPEETETEEIEVKGGLDNLRGFDEPEVLTSDVEEETPETLQANVKDEELDEEEEVEMKSQKETTTITQ